MMSKSMKNLMIRVMKKKMSEGKDLEEILESYPRLTDEEKQELREAVA